MRIWSLCPQYLDSKGLIALWRETLLAKHVLENKTKGYKNHPQLERFKHCSNPVTAINQYLSVVHDEACKRNYHFDKNKINWDFTPIQMEVSKGQVEFEFNHLLKKLYQRNRIKYTEICELNSIDTHSMFRIVAGDIEKWEVVK